MARARITIDVLRTVQEPALEVASEALKVHDSPAWEELPKAVVEVCSMLCADGALNNGGSQGLTDDYADFVDDAVDGFKRFGMFDRAEKIEQIVDLATELEEYAEGSSAADELWGQIDACVHWWFDSGCFWSAVDEVLRAEPELFVFDVAVPEKPRRG